MKEFFVDIVWGKILKPVWELWKAIANFILENIFRVLLFVFYFTIFTPFAILFNLFDQETFKPGWKEYQRSSATDLF